MSDPKLVDHYLALTRRALTPPPAFREQVQAHLQASQAVLGALATRPARVDRGQLRLSQRASVVAGGALLALGFLAGYGLRPVVSEGPPAPPLPRMIAAPSEALEVAEPDPMAQVAPQATAVPPEAVLPSASNPWVPAARGRSRAQRNDTAPTPPQLGPSDELALLQRAERAVRAENSALALMLTGELEERFPRSELLEERSAIELMAHCVARGTDARSRAERFLRAHPRSVYAERIALLCLGEPATPAADRD
jgi:hypothetical protein